MHATLQEKLCPQVLEFRTREYNLLTNELANYENRLRVYVETYQETKQGDKNFFQSIYQLEADRLQYLLKGYLRVRLAKVQSPLR